MATDTAPADRPVVIIDVEATGLNDTRRDHIWEVAIIRHDHTGRREDTFQIQHDTGLVADLPEKFRADHARRYDPSTALTPGAARTRLWTALQGQPTFVGAVPSYDAALIAQLLGTAPWHHRLRCVETLTAGHLGRDAGGLNDCLAALDLEPNPHAHMALPDALAAERIYAHLMPLPTVAVPS